MFSFSTLILFPLLASRIDAFPSSRFAARANGNDAQSSLTLDNKVLATGFEQDGQENVTESGQVKSLTSSNNFINFCLTRPDLKITNGLQIKDGSCNPNPMGLIPSFDKMPSSKFTNPKNMQTIQSNQKFSIQMAIQNIQTGNFVNPDTNYFAAPQQLNQNGEIIGHTHFVIEKLSTIDQTDLTDPRTFVFFKGVNTPAANGILSVDVTTGVPDGVFRLCSMNAAMNHQPAVVSVAKHGNIDDCSYFFATADGKPAAGTTGATAAAGADTTAATTTASATDSATATASTTGSSTTTTATKDDKNNNNNAKAINTGSPSLNAALAKPTGTAQATGGAKKGNGRRRHRKGKNVNGGARRHN